MYGAIAYYLGHRDEVERYLERQQMLWDQERQKIDEESGAIVQRLRALKGSQSQGMR